MCKKKKKELDHLLTPYMRINSNWIKDLNVRLKTIKILEESKGCKIPDISHSSICSDTSPQASKTKEKINKWDYIKLKRFFTAKENVNKVRRQLTELENTFAIKKWAKDLNRHFSKKDVQMANRNMKRCSTHWSSEKCKLKPQ